ncbi:DUF6603 domain-containing protein [Embleya hyalina]|uniref:DUF6603 domain-containing protein n=1 Tax=Embleya hyalina TaxID=516124 RepID=A0A401Z1D2_9ACTN|nr:DUF6603 domain-containing protein [Embleya hyalina]GCE00713.1 hypothetical protein EHYA_08439 [Embleya hyalina]
MALTTDELRRRFPTIGGEFRLTAAELAVPGTEDLFGTYLGGPLAVTGVTAVDPEHLTLSGAVTVPGLTPGAAATVTFTANTTASPPVVVGLTVDVTLTTAPDPGEWKIDLPYLRLEAGFLRSYGFDRLLLVLSAEPGADDAVSTVATVGGDLPFAAAGGAALRLRTLVQTGPAASTYTLHGAFAGVGFTTLGDLGQLVPGVPAGRFVLPDLPGLPLPATLELLELSVVFTPDAQRAAAGLDPVLGASVRVGIPARWDLIPGVFDVEEIDAEFGIASPRSTGANVHARLGGVLRVGDAFVGVSVSVPELDLTAELLQPLPLTDVLGLFVPGAQIPTGTVEAFGAWLDARSKDFGVELDLAGDWEIGDVFALTGITLSVEGTGTAGRTVGLSAEAAVGGTRLSIAARYDNGLWRFSGIANDLVPADLFALFDVAPPALLADLTVRETRVSFDSGGREFDLGCSCAFPLGDADAVLDLTARLTRRAAGGYDKNVAGTLTVRVPDGHDDPRTLVFAVEYHEQGPAATITGTWHADEGVALTDLVAALGIELPDLPEVLRPVLTALSVRYESATGRVLLTASTEHTGWVYAARPGTGPGAPRVHAAAVRARLGARASDLPLVGEAIPPGADLVVDGIAFTSTPTGWDAPQAAAINDALHRIDSGRERRLPRFAGGAAAGPGFAVQIELSIGGVAQDPLLLPITTGPGGMLVAAARTPLTVHAAPADTGARDLDLTFGAVRISRIGVGLADGRILVALDAVLSVGPVRLVLMGLGLGIDGELTVSPRLRGAGVQLHQPPLRISGMVERRTGSEVAPGLTEQFIGLASIETGFFALHAAGSYAKAVDGWSSMFLFGELSGGERGLFGPPPFRVIALSLGFGVNSTVRTPTIADVGTFPLVDRLDGSGSGDTPEQVLEKLAGPGGWITPREGRYWGAGGIEFSSFEFIRSRALLLVEGGEQWKVLLIGRTTIDLPRTKAATKPIARVVIDLAIGYHHDHGLFSMDAVIAPGSYVIDPAAELTGGLSLYIWGKDRTAVGGGRGFVFTLGGYHPRFKRPAYYPNPPRVGWRWAIGPVAIRGQVYAALTDGAFMAGGELSANYDKGHGIKLQAWFTAWLDALVQWKPFYFDLSMGLSIGVAATVKVLFIRVRVSLSVGVSLDLWGPPIGGRARIKVWFIGFTIGFGADRAGVPAVEWPEFAVQLPAPLSIAPLAGLLVDVDPEESASRSAAGEPLLVSGDGFTVRTESAVPASRITLNGKTFAGSADDTIDIRPMGAKGQGVVSEHHVTLERFDTEYTPTGWRVTVHRQDMPKGMWGAPLGKPTDVLDGDGLLTDRPAGLTFEIPEPELGPAVGWVDGKALKADGLPDAEIPRLGAHPEGPPSIPDDEGEGSIRAIVDPDTGIAAPTTAERRASVHAALAALGLAPGTDEPPTRYADLARSTFTTAPMTTTAER